MSRPRGRGNVVLNVFNCAQKWRSDAEFVLLEQGK